MSVETETNSTAHEPSVSIITVTYNCCSTLQRTLDSVERQQSSDIEHLIIDGGSTDGTLDIAHDYAQRLSARYPVRIVSERDNGIYDAMNKGLALARGKFVVFLNAGDKLHETTTLQRVIESITPSVAVIYGQTDIVDESGNYVGPRHHLAPDQLTANSFVDGMLVCHQSFYVRRSLAPAYDQQYRLSADYDWCIRTMLEAELRGMTMRNTQATLTDYLSEGMTTRHRRRSLMERLRIMARHYGWPATVGSHLKMVFKTIKKL